jgi:putative exporter of polyketide antibiotics
MIYEIISTTIGRVSNITCAILTILSLSPLTATVKSTGLENAATQGK